MSGLPEFTTCTRTAPNPHVLLNRGGSREARRLLENCEAFEARLAALGKMLSDSDVKEKITGECSEHVFEQRSVQPIVSVSAAPISRPARRSRCSEHGHFSRDAAQNGCADHNFLTLRCKRGLSSFWTSGVACSASARVDRGVDADKHSRQSSSGQSRSEQWSSARSGRCEQHKNNIFLARDWMSQGALASSCYCRHEERERLQAIALARIGAERRKYQSEGSWRLASK